MLFMRGSSRPERRELLVDHRQVSAAHRNTRVTIKPRPVRTAWSVPPGMIRARVAGSASAGGVAMRRSLAGLMPISV